MSGKQHYRAHAIGSAAGQAALAIRGMIKNSTGQDRHSGKLEPVHMLDLFA